MFELLVFELLAPEVFELLAPELLAPEVFELLALDAFEFFLENRFENDRLTLLVLLGVFFCSFCSELHSLPYEQPLSASLYAFWTNCIPDRTFCSSSCLTVSSRCFVLVCILFLLTQVDALT